MTASNNKLLSASFIVSSADLTPDAVLSICRILKGVTDQTDAAIVRATGFLDYGQLQVKHYHLDVVGSARLNDTVVIHTYVRSYAETELAIDLRAVRKRRNKEAPLVNGSFVYAVRTRVGRMC